MKKVLLGIFAAVTTLHMSSCSEDFKIAAPYKDITVVYGMLQHGNNAHYIRIQKAFIDENKSALELAKIADSNFYKDIEVRMKVINGAGSVVENTILRRVNMADEGLPKEPGTFFTEPSYAYKHDNLLPTDPSYTFRLVITNKVTGNVDSATTRLIDSAPTSFDIFEFTRNVYTINFQSNSAVSNYSLSFDRISPHARYLEGYIRFKYVTADNGVQKDSSFIWRFTSLAVPEGQTKPKLEVTTNQFLPIFKANIPPATATEVRYLDSADVFVWAADNNYYNYMLANQVQGGITADQVKPLYTTIQGKNVVGMFGSRAMRTRFNVPISDLSLDSLKQSNITSDLRFVGRSDH